MVLFCSNLCGRQFYSTVGIDDVSEIGNQCFRSNSDAFGHTLQEVYTDNVVVSESTSACYTRNRNLINTYWGCFIAFNVYGSASRINLEQVACVSLSVQSNSCDSEVRRSGSLVTGLCNVATHARTYIGHAGIVENKIGFVGGLCFRA